jgi:tetratricopeptide (TPR) repeat protein
MVDAHPRMSLEAFQRFLQARHALNHLSHESMGRARQLLEEALRIEGEHERLLAMFGILESVAFSIGASVDEATLHRGDAYATRALALNPRSALALYAKGILAEKTNLARSLEFLRRSVAIEPVPEAMGLLAAGLAVRGDEAEALEYSRRAVPLDPLSPAVLAFAIVAAWFGGAIEQALAWSEAALRAIPDNTSLLHTAGYVIGCTGDTSRALALLDRAASNEEYFSVMSRLTAQAIRRQPLNDLAPASDTMIRRDPHGSFWIADIYACAGDRDKAIAWLGNAVRLGVTNIRYMTERSPYLSPMRGDPAFETIVAQARARVYG